MGADIHYAIEAQDMGGNWHTLFVSDLCYSAWFDAFCDERTPYSPDNHGFCALRRRSYTLFGLLSDVRGTHPFPDRVGGSRGIAQPYGDAFHLPDDASAFAREVLGGDNERHSQGWIDGRDIRTLIRKLGAITPHTNVEQDAIDVGITFLRNAKRLMRLVGGKNGTPGLFGTPITHVPTTSDESPCPDLSAHTLLNITAMLRSPKGLALKRMRILIAYDN